MNKKVTLCNRLIRENKVKEMDVIKHSYSTSRMSGRKLVESNNIMITLDTRRDCIGIVVNYEKSCSKEERSLRDKTSNN